MPSPVGSVCPPSKAIFMKNLIKSCAMALFLQDPAKTKEECDRMRLNGEVRRPCTVYIILTGASFVKGLAPKKVEVKI